MVKGPWLCGAFKDTPTMLSGTRANLRRNATGSYSVLKAGLSPCRDIKQKQMRQRRTLPKDGGQYDPQGESTRLLKGKVSADTVTTV